MSIYDSGSGDDSHKWIRLFQLLLCPLNVPFHVSMDVSVDNRRVCIHPADGHVIGYVIGDTSAPRIILFCALLILQIVANGDIRRLPTEDRIVFMGRVGLDGPFGYGRAEINVSSGHSTLLSTLLSHPYPEAQIRNAALEPLLTPDLGPPRRAPATILGKAAQQKKRHLSSADYASGRDRVVYVNDVYFCMHQLLRLVMLDQVINSCPCVARESERTSSRWIDCASRPWTSYHACPFPSPAGSRTWRAGRISRGTRNRIRIRCGSTVGSMPHDEPADPCVVAVPASCRSPGLGTYVAPLNGGRGWNHAYYFQAFIFLCLQMFGCQGMRMGTKWRVSSRLLASLLNHPVKTVCQFLSCRIHI